MKTLADGTQVSSRSYYYLLDYNDATNFVYLRNTIGKGRLCDLNINEYRELFKKATTDDYRAL